MVDPEINIGDVAIDLVERGKVFIMGRPAMSVSEYRKTQDFDLKSYKSHPLLHVSDDEPVYEAVYLPKNPTVELGNTYTFPASRLARVPIEEADDSAVRPQHEMAVTIVSSLLHTYDTMPPELYDEGDAHRLEVAIEETFDEELVELIWDFHRIDGYGGDDSDE